MTAPTKTRGSTPNRRKPHKHPAPGHPPSTFAWSRRKTWITALVAAAALGTAATYYATRHTGPQPPAPVTTVAQNKRACLLTDPGQPDAITALAGMQQARKGLGNLNIQQATLPAHATDAASSLAGLVQLRCTVIITVGPLSTAAATAAAANTHTATPAYIIISVTSIHPANTIVLPATGLTIPAVAAALATALK